MEAIGTKIRRQRRRLGLTLEELAGRTGISKPYLSLIETGRVSNPPRDEKLRRLEQTLGFTAGQLLTQAHLLRTPRDVRAVLKKLINGNDAQSADAETLIANGDAKTRRREDAENGSASISVSPCLRVSASPSVLASSRISASTSTIDLDDAYLSGALQELVEQAAGNVETMATNAVPVINRVSAGYPKDFTDLSYPPRVADDYVSCPDIHDQQAFAARVHGDSMTPKYRQGDIVIFSPAVSPRDGDDCFVRFSDGHTTFKRVFFETAEDGSSSIRLQPRNERYRPQVVRGEEITGLYRAVYRYQRVDGE